MDQSSPDALRAAATALFESMAAGDEPRMRALFRHDAEWIGPQSAVELGFPVPLLGADTIAATICRARQGYEYLDVAIERILVEGEHAAALLTFAGKRRGGPDYANRYLFMLSFIDGLIRTVHESTDTAHVRKIRSSQA